MTTKILINSYSPNMPGSYGILARQLWKLLHRTGQFKILQLGWFNRPILDPVEWKVVPTKIKKDEKGRSLLDPADQWGQLSLEETVKQFNPDIVWSLGDPYMLAHVPPLAAKYSFKHVVWSLLCASPFEASATDVLGKADRSIAMTKYAAEAWSSAMGKDFGYIPCGVDSRIFNIVDEEKKLSLRESIGRGKIQPKDVVALYVGRNQDRKRPWNYIPAIKYLSEGMYWIDSNGHTVLPKWDFNKKTYILPDNHADLRWQRPIPIKLYMHTPSKMAKDGWDFEQMADQWGLDRSTLITTDGLSDATGVSEEEMACLYQMSDIVLMASGAEGFGMPITEAAACGVQSIVTNYSGCEEVGRNCLARMIEPGSYNPATNGCWIANPTIEGIVEAIDHFDKLPRPDPQEIRKAAISQYDWNSIAMSWLAVLKSVEAQKKTISFGVSL